MSLVTRSIISAVVGAALGVAVLAGVSARDPGLTFEMSGPLPAFISGFHPPERDGANTFAWTAERVDIDLRQLDRRAPWSCSLRFRAPRPADLPLPVADVLVDDRRVASLPATGDYQDLGFTIASGARGARVAINVSPTFVPGPHDKRTLGVQIDRLACRPTGMAWPPGPATRDAALAAALTALLFSLAGLSLTGSILGAFVIAWGSASMLTAGAAAYGSYSHTILMITVWIVTLASVLVRLIDGVRKTSLTQTARIVFAISAVALAVKMFGLLHPAKPADDAIFNAHRLGWVIGGKRFFTQQFVGDVQMPYAIGLYVFAWPWTWLVTNFVALIRTVTAASDIAAGALLYPVVVSAWQDRRAGVLAVLAYQLVPLSFAYLGDANLPNIFAQSMALAAMAAAVSWPMDLRRPLALVAFTAITTWALCSHVGAVSLITATFGVLTVLYYWRGDSTRRSAAVAIGVALAAALVLSWFLYYGHFTAEFAAAAKRMFSGGANANPATAAEATRGFMTRSERLRDLASQAAAGFSWPLLILALVGLWSLWRRRVRDRLTSALIAWGAVWLLASASTVFARVDKEFVRYAAEFLGRINLATVPLVAILAGRGAAAGWDESTPGGSRVALRAVAILLIGLAIIGASRSLTGWFAR